jgi:catechol 2,3-dioxygenase-like lactoylglutathione lyase family enzyme
MHGEFKLNMNSRLDLGHTSPQADRLACVWASSRSAVWAPQGGDGQKQVLELSTLPGVENVVLAPSQGYQRPRRAARRRRRTAMAIQRMDHVSVVVDDLAAAKAFFGELGLELEGEAPIEGSWVDRVNGLDGVRVDIAMMRTPDGHGRLELTKFHSPTAVSAEPQNAPGNTLGLRSIMFAVDDLDATVAGLRARGAELVGEVAQYQDSYRLCYVRGPAGIIVALAEQLS